MASVVNNEMVVEMARKQKTTSATYTLCEAVSNAFSAIDELKEELQSWYDNLPEAFQNGSKGQALEEAINYLESSSEPETPESVSDFEVTINEATGRLSRAARRDNAVALVDAVISEVESKLSELGDLTYNDDGWLVLNGVVLTDKDDPEISGFPHAESVRDEAVTDLEAFHDELDSAKSEWESVEFPGMFG